MKKRILCLLAAAVTVIACLTGMVLPASAAREHTNAIERCTLYDPDNLFDETNQESLRTIIRGTSDQIDMYIAVYILNESGAGMDDYQVRNFADDKYDELFNVQYEEESDGLMLVLNMPTHYIYISTCGMGQLYYYNGSEDDRISAMNNNLHSYLRSGDYAGAVTRFCSDAVYYYQRGIPKNVYTYNSDNGMYSYQHHGELVHAKKLPWWFGIRWGFWGGIAAVAAVLAALISYLVIRNSYQLKKSLNASNYISQKETQFYVQDDVFIRAHTTKHHIDRSGGGGGFGGGGGSSHMSSGGFSHGGGGSHW